MKRNILSVVIGLAVAIIIFLLGETVNGAIHPFPSDVDLSDNLAVGAFFKNQAFPFWLMVLLGWAIGSIICGYLIKLISKNDSKTLPILAGSILTLSAIANFFALPHPTWFIVVSLIVFIPSTLLGHYLSKTK